MNSKGIVVLEGPDGAGKTTLANHLVDTYGARYVHGRVFNDCWKSHTAMLRLACRWSSEGLVVLDRHWPSEAIYGTTFRGNSQYSPNERSIERVLLKHAALYVMVLPANLSGLKERFERLKSERYEDFPEVSEVAKRYADLWSGNVISGSYDGTYVDQLTRLGGVSRLFNWFRYDFESGIPMEEQAEAIVHKLGVIRRLQLPEALDHENVNVTGHIYTARYLFVGDKLGDPSGPTQWPFYGRKRSSKFLNVALHKLAFPEHHAMFTNINDESRDMYDKIMEMKPSLKVICFGRDAQNGILAKYGKMEKLRIYHPSYANRFMHHGNYDEHLWEAING